MWSLGTRIAYTYLYTRQHLEYLLVELSRRHKYPQIYYRYYCSCKEISSFDLSRYQNKSNVLFKFLKYCITILKSVKVRTEVFSLLGLLTCTVLTCKKKKHNIFCFFRARLFAKNKLNIICEILKTLYLRISQPLPRFQFSTSSAHNERLRI